MSPPYQKVMENSETNVLGLVNLMDTMFVMVVIYNSWVSLKLVYELKDKNIKLMSYTKLLISLQGFTLNPTRRKYHILASLLYWGCKMGSFFKAGTLKCHKEK